MSLIVGNITKGVRIIPNLHISCILFFDEILIFGTTIYKTKCLENILRLFSYTTKMEINHMKSSIYFFHVPQFILYLILKFLPLSLGSTKECIKYLNFLLKSKDYDYQDFLWLYEKLKKRVSLWCNRWI
jgi:hypothetical protein